MGEKDEVIDQLRSEILVWKKANKLLIDERNSLLKKVEKLERKIK